MNHASTPISWRFVLGLCTGAFLLRLAVIVLLRDLYVGPEGAASNDDVAFEYCAQSVARGDGFSNIHNQATSFRAPGFSFFLAGLYWIFGVHPPLVYVVLAILGAINAALCYFLARELLPDAQAKAAAILAAVYLGHINVALNYISENLFVPLLTLGAWLFVRFLRQGGWWQLGLSGLVLGYATLTRPFSQLLLPLWGLLLCWHFRREPKRLLAACLVYAVPFLAPIVPWTLRNYQVHGHFVLITTNGGSTFYGGNNDIVSGTPRAWGYWVSTVELPGRDLIEAAPTEYDHDQVEWRLGKEWIRNNPGKAAFLVVLKVVSLWLRPPEFQIGASTVYPLRILLYAPILVLLLVGVWRCVRERELRDVRWMSLHLTMLATIATAMIFAGLARFRDANVSFMMIYTVLGAVGILDWWRGRRAARTIDKGGS